RSGYTGLHHRERRTGQSACARRLSVDRLRPLYGQTGRGHRPAQRTLAGAGQDRMWVARLVTTLMLTAHGSKDPRSAANARAVARRIAGMRPGLDVRLAFCELNAPSLVDVLNGCAGDAVVTPLLLADAYHARVDIPSQIAHCGANHRVQQANVLG